MIELRWRQPLAGDSDALAVESKVITSETCIELIAPQHPSWQEASKAPLSRQIF
jgi:hypothetical protein